MKRLRCGVVLTASVLMAGCVSSSGGGLAVPLHRQDVDADKVFHVMLDKSGTDCVVSVLPDSGTDTRVEAGWKVAWLLVNRCDNTDALTLEFFLKTGSVRKEPVHFRPYNDGVLQGKVRRDPWNWFNDCDTWDPAPCGAYKYNIRVGQWALDPDFEIIVY